MSETAAIPAEIGVQIDRLNTAKDELQTALEGKGVSVPDGELISEYPALVESITGGGVLPRAEGESF